MKKILISSALVLLLGVSSAHAGFWGSLAGGAIGSAATNQSGGCGAPDRMEKANSYLWDMHKKGKYEEGYEFYLQYVELSDSISYLDTVANVYNDNGNKEKALEIYEKRILPWVALEDADTKRKFRAYYDEIKGS